MHPRPFHSLVLLGTLAVLIASCGGDASDTAEDPATAPSLSDQEISQDLPSGHPPVSGMPPATDMGIVQPPAGSGTGETGLTWQTPDSWIEEDPRSAMRRAQYRVPGEAGDAECVVFYFGPGQGGGPMDNAERWADQFTQPDGSSPRDVMTTEQLEVGEMKVLLTEVTGTYSGGMAMMGGPSENLEGYMLLGAIAEGPDANWFFKLTGPEATVAAQREAFRAMIRSLTTGS
jgi:hypothetical protein